MTDFKDRPPLPGDWTPEHIRGLRDAARADNADALVSLGEFYSDGLRNPDGTVLVRRDLREAMRCFERATQLGDAEGMCALAGHLTRSGVSARSSDIARAEALYRASFRKGYVTAAYNLACTYQNVGRHSESVRWYQRAHNAGDPSALFQIALAELYGLGTKRDPNKAFAKLRRVAASRTKYWPASRGENVQAMLVIAQALMDGWHLPRDYGEAQRWLRRAADWDSLTAKALLEER